jgi:hypothetical protein
MTNSWGVTQPLLPQLREFSERLLRLRRGVDPRIEDRLLRGEVTDRLDALKRGEKVVIKEQKRLKYVKDNKLQPITSFFKPVSKK